MSLSPVCIILTSPVRFTIDTENYLRNRISARFGKGLKQFVLLLNLLLVPLSHCLLPRTNPIRSWKLPEQTGRFPFLKRIRQITSVFWVSIVFYIFAGGGIGQSGFYFEELRVNDRFNTVFGEVAGCNLPTDCFNSFDRFLRCTWYSDIYRRFKTLFSLLNVSLVSPLKNWKARHRYFCKDLHSMFGCSMKATRFYKLFQRNWFRRIDSTFVDPAL